MTNPRNWRQTIAPRHWEVLAVLPDGHGYRLNGFAQRCGHRHATQDEATMCPWTPDPWPVVCDLLVRQVRSPSHRDRREQGRMGW